MEVWVGCLAGEHAQQVLGLYCILGHVSLDVDRTPDLQVALALHHNKEFVTLAWMRQCCVLTSGEQHKKLKGPCQAATVSMCLCTAGNSQAGGTGAHHQDSLS